MIASSDRRPIPFVLVRLEESALAVLTDSAGLFTLAPVPPGQRRLRIRNFGWTEQVLDLDVASGTTLSLLITLSPAAIELGPLEVDARAAGALALRASGARLNVITRERIEPLEGTNTTLADLLVQNVAGVRLRRLNNYVGSPVCIEFRNAGGARAGCNSPEVFLDGARIGNPTFLYGVIDLSTIERLEVIPPSEAGVRFGAGAQRGALLIETRRPGASTGERASARAGAATASRASPGTWDWTSEPVPHRTPAVYASSFVGGAAGLGLGLLAASQCLRLRERTQDSLVSDCDALTTVGVGLASIVLPAVGGGLAAGIAGRTQRSRGRLFPAATGAAALLVPGYALVISGQRSGGSGIEWIGRALIVVGAPFAATLADRLYRRRR